MQSSLYSICIFCHEFMEIYPIHATTKPFSAHVMEWKFLLQGLLLQEGTDKEIHLSLWRKNVSLERQRLRFLGCKSIHLWGSCIAFDLRV